MNVPWLQGHNGKNSNRIYWLRFPILDKVLLIKRDKFFFIRVNRSWNAADWIDHKICNSGKNRRNLKMSTFWMRQIVFGIPEFANKMSKDIVKYLLRLISRMEHLTLFKSTNVYFVEILIFFSNLYCELWISPALELFLLALPSPRLDSGRGIRPGSETEVRHLHLTGFDGANLRLVENRKKSNRSERNHFPMSSPIPSWGHPTRLLRIRSPASTTSTILGIVRSLSRDRKDPSGSCLNSDLLDTATNWTDSERFETSGSAKSLEDSANRVTSYGRPILTVAWRHRRETSCRRCSGWGSVRDDR